MESDFVGKTLSHYRVLSFEGKGGMKLVYRGFDERLHRHVAIKVLRGPHLDESERGRIRQEALVLSRLNHANVEIVHDFDSQDGVDFLVTEFIEGTTLDRRIGGRPIPEREAIALGCQVADALVAAHMKRIIHRDLKPANIIVTGEGLVKVLDFGIAKLLAGGGPDETTHTWTDAHPPRGVAYTDPRGTLPYMAPEALLERRVDARTDLYALGVVLFEMVTGRRPFAHDRPTALVQEICYTPPPAPRALNRHLSGRLEELILKCLEKRPELRYQSALEVRVDLLRAESGRVPPELIPDSPRGAARISAWLARNARPWIAGVVVLGMASAAWFVTRRPVPSVLPQRQLTHVTAAVSPALSPDGDYFAFVDQSESGRGPHRIFVQSVAGGEPREVFSSDFCTGLRWSPDGSRLLFLSAGSATEIPRAHIAPWPGGEVRSFDSSGLVGAWAPDGRRFATALYSERMIHVTDAATGTKSSFPIHGDIQRVKDLDWSPRGSRIAVLTRSEQGQSSVWTMTPEGREARLALTDSLEYGALRWTPDGGAFYVLRSNQESWDLLRVVPGSRRRSRLLVSGLQVELSSSITLSRDGSRFLYSRATERRNLHMLERGTEVGGAASWTPRPLTSGAFLETQPRFSPDGRSIAFARAEGMTSEIFLVPVAGGPPKRLTHLERWSGDVAWSPDGSELAFCSNIGGRFQVHRVRAAGGPVRAWARTDASGLGRGLAWGPGRYVLYPSPGDHNYVLLDPATGSQRRLLSRDSAGMLFHPQSAPDGSRVALLWNDWPSTSTWIVPLDGSPVEETVEGLPVGWSPDGGSVFVLQGSRKPPRIVRYDRRTRRSDEVVQLPFGSEKIDGAMNAAGDRFVFAVPTRESNVWLIERTEGR